jgi:hypothetical protein
MIAKCIEIWGWRWISRFWKSEVFVGEWDIMEISKENEMKEADSYEEDCGNCSEWL